VTLEGLRDFAQKAWQVAAFLRAQLVDAEAKLWEEKFSSPYTDELKRLVVEQHPQTSAETEGGGAPSNSK